MSYRLLIYMSSNLPIVSIYRHLLCLSIFRSRNSEVTHSRIHRHINLCSRADKLVACIEVMGGSLEPSPETLCSRGTVT